MKANAVKELCISDYPKSEYSAYWEYFAPFEYQVAEMPVRWVVRFMDFETSAVLSEKSGTATDVAAARKACQELVVTEMPKYRRKEV